MRGDVAIHRGTEFLPHAALDGRRPTNFPAEAGSSAAHQEPDFRPQTGTETGAAVRERSEERSRLLPLMNPTGRLRCMEPTGGMVDDLQFVAVPSMAAPPRDLPLRSCRAGWLQWVGLRPTPHPIRRRKAAVGGSLPASCRSPTSPVDPMQPSSFDGSCRSTVELSGAHADA